ncbi:MAG TPA: hypothetical protein VFZ32_00085 [Micromonosporaceae bacterium]
MSFRRVIVFGAVLVGASGACQVLAGMDDSHRRSPCALKFDNSRDEPEQIHFTDKVTAVDGIASTGVVNFYSAGNIVVGESHTRSKQCETLAERRQRFFFEFLNHSLKQAEWTFRLSIWFMSGGAAVILTGAILALVYAGNPDVSYLPYVTALTGALFTVGGGALAVHARRARTHVTEQADRLDLKIDLDHKLETATSFIERVSDPVAKDRNIDLLLPARLDNSSAVTPAASRSARNSPASRRRRISGLTNWTCVPLPTT